MISFGEVKYGQISPNIGQRTFVSIDLAFLYDTAHAMKQLRVARVLSTMRKEAVLQT